MVTVLQEQPTLQLEIAKIENLIMQKMQQNLLLNQIKLFGVKLNIEV